jgi:hypothetical protein
MLTLSVCFDPGYRNWGLVVLLENELLIADTWDLLETLYKKQTFSCLLQTILPKFLLNIQKLYRWIENTISLEHLPDNDVRLKIICEDQPNDKLERLSKFLCGIAFVHPLSIAKKRSIVFMDKRSYVRKKKRQSQKYDVKKDAIQTAKENGYDGVVLKDQHQYDALFLFLLTR